MASTTSSISSLSTIITQEILHNFHSRKLLLHNPLYNSPPLATAPSGHDSSYEPKQSTTFDANVVMVLSVLLCALICSLGLNSIIRCALRCSTFAASDSSHNGPSPRVANTGVKKKALKSFPIITYATDLKQPGLDTECAICLSDFATGERVKILPKCHHGFHVRCIDKWLGSHSSCPTCRHCLIETSKIAGSSQVASSSEPVSQPPPCEVVIRIQPLQPEGLIRNPET